MNKRTKTNNLDNDREKLTNDKVSHDLAITLNAMRHSTPISTMAYFKIFTDRKRAILKEDEIDEQKS